MHIVKREFGFERTLRSRSIPHPYKIIEHLHQHVELIIVTGGNIFLTVNGKGYTLNEGDVAVIMPFSPHSIRTENENSLFWLSVFSSSVLPGAREDRELTSPRATPCFKAPDHLISYVKGEVNIYDTGYTHIVDSIPRGISSALYAIITEYIRCVPKGHATENDTALSRLILYITENYKEDITRESAGKALGYNPRYLSQVLSSFEGISFRTLLNSCRADLARGLLLATDMRIIDIAYECGYKEERTFRRAFRTAVGMSPAEYRERHRA